MAQLDLDFTAAAAKRDEGMQSAVEHADDDVPTWSDVALGYVRQYARHHAIFMAEEVREYAAERGFAAPPDGRAWGAVMRRAVREVFIVKHGYAPAASSNLSPKVQWQSLLCRAEASAA